MPDITDAQTLIYYPVPALGGILFFRPPSPPLAHHLSLSPFMFTHLRQSQ